MAGVKLSYSIQRVLLTLFSFQLGYLAWQYIQGSVHNHFPILEQLFKPEAAAVFTQSGGWQSIVPFLAATYISIAIISLLALCFRPGRELRLLMVGLASVHLVMACIRQTIAPAELYIEGAAIRASLMQLCMGGLMLVSAALPYPQKKNNLI